MRHQLWLLPAALLAAAPASARIYSTVAAAQHALFPTATLTPRFITLTAWQIGAIERLTDVPVRADKLKVWRASSGGWFIIDQVEGKEDTISYAVALDADGHVRGVEILECLGDYDTITMPEWRAQFIGLKSGDLLAGVETISGATLSSRHVAEGVKRVLATYAVALKPDA